MIRVLCYAVVRGVVMIVGHAANWVVEERARLFFLYSNLSSLLYFFLFVENVVQVLDAWSVSRSV